MSEGVTVSAPPHPTAQRRQLVLITLGAIGIYLGLRALPTGTNLSHMDFRASGGSSIEFCDPANPQFIPVVSVRSPVTMTLTTGAAAVAGQPAACRITLRTASGKPIAPEDLLVVHTQKMHLLITDPSLTDYQHVHPTPGRTPGDWNFSFTPRFGGTYRIFADFTPVATGRGLYAAADAEVSGGKAEIKPRNVMRDSAAENSITPPVAMVERDGFRFLLNVSPRPLRARQPLDLRFLINRPDGGAVPMQPVMGAFAHLVAFDEARSGFAHLHPMELDLSKPPDATHPELNFKLTIPQPGRYVIWAQVNLGGHETFVPFWFEVE